MPRIIEPKSNLFPYLDILLAVVLSAILLLLLVHQDIYATHDGFAHATWGHYWSRQFFNGQISPRWFEDAFGGLGSPSFVFYPPLFRWLGLPFAIIGLLPSMQIKGALLLVLAINALGVVLLSRMLFAKNSLCTAAAIFLGIFNPYLLMGIFKRGAAGEVTATALIPWLIMGLYIAIHNKKPWRLLPLVMALTLLFLSHVPSSLIFVSCCVVSTGICIVLRHRSWRYGIFLLTPLVLALLLSAYFVFPILFDVPLIGGVGDPPYSNRFLLNNITGFHFRLPEAFMENTLAGIFLFNGLILILAVFVTKPWKAKDSKRLLLEQSVLMVIFALFMMTDLSKQFYETLTVFKKLRFPWRFLIITSSLMPYLFGYTMEILRKKFFLYKKTVAIIVLSVPLLLIIYKSAGIFFTQENDARLIAIDQLIKNNARVPDDVFQRIDHADLGDYYLLHLRGKRYFYLDRNLRFIQPDAIEYLPATVPLRKWLDPKDPSPGPRIPTNLFQQYEFVEGKGNIFNQERWPGYRRLQLTAATAVILNIATFYYPGWKMQVTPAPMHPQQSASMSAAEDGRIQLKFPPGTYDITIRYRGTPAEKIGFWVSLCSIIAIALLGKITASGSMLDRLNR
jgi:hypothetical protein